MIAGGSPGALAIEYSRSARYPSSAVSRTSRCCPARWPGQSGTSSTIVLTRAVSSMTSSTVAICQLNRPRSAALATGHRTCGSRTSPRIPARPRREARARGPTSRSSRSRGAVRAAAPGRRARARAARRRRRRRPERFPSVTSSSGRFVVYPPSEKANMRRVVLDLRQQRVDRHSLPHRVELRPAGDAVDVDRHRLARRSARNSSHVHVFLSSPETVRTSTGQGVCGVGPAESTGKSSVRYWPGAHDSHRRRSSVGRGSLSRRNSWFLLISC